MTEPAVRDVAGRPGHVRPTTRPRTPVPRRGGRLGGRATPYLFVAPLLVVFAGFYLWPAVSTVVSSLFRWGLLNPWRPTDTADWDFAGLGNYRDTLTGSDFWNAAFNTLVWLVVFPVLVTAFSLLVSILLWYTRVGTALLRSVFILPMTISLAAAGVIWGFLYNPSPHVGALNAVLHAVGIPSQTWLSDLGAVDLGFVHLQLTNFAVIVPGVWAFAGFGVITLTAGLTALPSELVEAAQVDGARALQVVRHVIVPCLRGPLVVVVVVSVIFALRTFDIVYVTTGGDQGATRRCWPCCCGRRRSRSSTRRRPAPRRRSRC